MNGKLIVLVLLIGLVVVCVVAVFAGAYGFASGGGEVDILSPDVSSVASGNGVAVAIAGDGNRVSASASESGDGDVVAFIAMLFGVIVFFVFGGVIFLRDMT